MIFFPASVGPAECRSDMPADPGEETSGVPLDGNGDRMVPGPVRLLLGTIPPDPDRYSDPFPTIALAHRYSHNHAHTFPDAFPHA